MPIYTFISLSMDEFGLFHLVARAKRRGEEMYRTWTSPKETSPGKSSAFPIKLHRARVDSKNNVAEVLTKALFR